MNPFKNVVDLQAQIDSAIAAYDIETFKELFARFFHDHQMVEQVYWEQYAPAFNDGEPCYFSVRDGWILVSKQFTKDYPTIVTHYDEEAEDSEESGAMESPGYFQEGSRWFDTENPKSNDGVTNQLQGLTKARNDLYELLEVEDLLKKVFGDCHGILVTRMKDGSVELQCEEIEGDY